ncbi:uncharacterized protein [Oscarella lobularis]|uniref:uncharacterized protein isoform X2 n=1 Tax=Oscarella lobularis TaxID=121494 RepID=UPI0033143D4D
MKALLALLAIGLMRFARSGSMFSDEELKMLFCPVQDFARSGDIKEPLAFIKCDGSVLSLSLPNGSAPEEIFLTQVAKTKSLIWSTFKPQKRLGVDTNGTLEINNKTTFKQLDACHNSNTIKMQYPLYKALCASRGNKHFLVSMKGFGVKGFKVTDCDTPLSGPSEDEFCKKSTLWRDYYHYHKYFGSNPNLAWEKCLSFGRNNKTCSNNNNNGIGAKPPEPDHQAKELSIQKQQSKANEKTTSNFVFLNCAWEVEKSESSKGTKVIPCQTKYKSSGVLKLLIKPPAASKMLECSKGKTNNCRFLIKDLKK